MTRVCEAVNVQPPKSNEFNGAADQPAVPQNEPADPEPRRPRVTSLQIELVEDAGNWSTFGDIATVIALVQDAADAVAGAAPVASRLPGKGRIAEAVVALSSDAEISILNGQYRGKPKPTNVLSFPAAAAAFPGGDTTDPVSIGDIVLASETVLSEAVEMGISPADHLRHLVVHGLLHLLGYDHIEAAEADEMEALESQILATMGIADPYAGSELVDAPT